MRKSRFGIALLVALALAVPAGGFLFAGGAKEGTAAAKGGAYTMVSIPKLRATWFDRLEVGLKKAGQEHGVNVSQQAPAAADEAQQVRLIEDAINQGNNAILVVPNDANSIVPAFARAQAQKIVTITHESPNQQTADFDVEMIDNVAFGEKAAELMVQHMGATEGEYVIFVGSLTVPAHNIWADAAVALARRKYPGLQEVANRFPASEDQNAGPPDRAGRHHRPPEHQGLPDLRLPGRPGRRPGGARAGPDRQDRGPRHHRPQPGLPVPEGRLLHRLHPLGPGRGGLRHGLPGQDRPRRQQGTASVPTSRSPPSASRSASTGTP